MLPCLRTMEIKVVSIQEYLALEDCNIKRENGEHAMRNYFRVHLSYLKQGSQPHF